MVPLSMIRNACGPRYRPPKRQSLFLRSKIRLYTPFYFLHKSMPINTQLVRVRIYVPVMCVYAVNHHSFY
ncbi:unnamed protein product [Meloidogyne enterolobii]|uniref:Uncharacterized protein n=1 Tax=Meloidogyne enterolobii TaxID=390850 RepID=A0ACB1B342_MELEN